MGGAATFFCLTMAAAALYEAVSLAILWVVRLRGGPAGEAKMLTGFSRVVLILLVAGVLLYATGALKALGSVAALLAGSLLGWSLQAPVSGMAAWALITLKRPFRVGDRVLFPSLGLLGDVAEVGLMYTKLDQVGGAVGSEEAIGRDILIPNAMLFSQVAINYTPQQAAAYSLDEVVVRLTYDSDWDAAEKILLNAAGAVTADIIKATGKEPYIRSDIYDYGVYMRLRYMTSATDRPRIAHEILKRVFHEFQRNPKVDFAIPYIYSFRKGSESGPRPMAGGPEQAAEIPLQDIIDPEADQPPTPDEMRDVEALARRIQSMGLLQPIVVRRTEDGRYELIAGRQRLLACRSLGWQYISALVKRPRAAEKGPADA
jgi:small-conductance mechanosensitive channel